jgi:nucleotide-binding universal stress UspA family protein
MFRRILVPIDCSATSNCGLDEAIGPATDRKAKICLLDVVDELIVARWGKRLGLYAVEL